MEKNYKVAVIKNYRKANLKIILLLLIGILTQFLISYIIKQNIFSLPSNYSNMIPIVSMILLPIMIIIVAIKNYTIDNVIVYSDYISSKIGQIKFDEIVKIKIQRFKGTMLIITMKNGVRIGFAPKSNFSNNADKTFEDFVESIQKKKAIFDRNTARSSL